MKIELQISPRRENEVRRTLEDAGIEIGSDADFVLTEREAFAESINCCEGEGWRVVFTKEICYIESFGHEITLHTAFGSYRVKHTLSMLSAILSPHDYMRISNSVIVRRDAIEHISASFSRKFSLRLKNGAKVDVTRSYFYKFKEWMVL